MNFITLKLKKKLLSALIIVSLSTATLAQNKREIEVSIESDGTHTTKIVKLNGEVQSEQEVAELEANGETTTETISINGKELSAQNIAEMKADGNIRIIHVEDGGFSGLSKDIQVLIDTDDGTTTKKVIMNGKELTQDEIAEFEASGELPSFPIDAAAFDGVSSGQVMLLNPDEKGLDSKMLRNISKSITKTISIDDGGATLGFMTNIQDNGWHVISVVDGSGAQDAGLKAGDIIKFMGEKDLTTTNGGSIKDRLNMPKREVGDMVDLEVERDGKLIYMSAEARENSSYDMVMDMNIDGKHSDFSWVDNLKGINTIVDGKNMKVMVLNGKMGDSFDFDNVGVNLPEMVGNMSFFMRDGKSTSKLLGKNHEMSALSKGLESYFKTKGGVLMMHVSDDNVFDLEDGDVIKSIAGVDVNTPKEVIKQLLKADKQEGLKLNVVRHKKNKTLKYQK